MNLNKLLLLSSFTVAALTSFGQTTQRIPLYETFTSSTCPPCKPGNIHLEGLFADPVNQGKYTSIKYQMSWPGTGDPYYTLEGSSRRSLYAVNSVPRLELDGGFDNGPTLLTQEDMDAAYANPAIVELKSYYQVNEATKTVTIQIEVKALQDIESAGGFFLHCGIFEFMTTDNKKSNGELEFEHVMKKMVPGAGGTYLGSMDADEVKTFELSYSFNGDYFLPADATDPIDHAYEHSVEEFSDLGVAVWVQRTSTREVYQSGYALNGFAGISETDVTGISSLTIYPNPSNYFTNIIFATNADAGDATVQVMDYTGKVVFQTIVANQGDSPISLQMDTESLANGMYIVTISTKNGVKSQKLTIAH